MTSETLTPVDRSRAMMGADLRLDRNTPNHHSAMLVSNWIEHCSRQGDSHCGDFNQWLGRFRPTAQFALLDSQRLVDLARQATALDDEAYCQRLLLPAESAEREPLLSLLRRISQGFRLTSEDGPLVTAEALWTDGEDVIPVAILAQNRQVNQGIWQPHHHRKALTFLHHCEARRLPLITFIDTPGAAADHTANRDNQAHSISALIAAMASLTVPSVGILFGVGYSGGAIPLATTNVLLSVRDGLFNTIAPKGLASIARRQHLGWQACARQVGVSAVELAGQALLDGVLDYSPLAADGAAIRKFWPGAKAQGDTPGAAHPVVVAALAALAWIEQRRGQVLRECEPLAPLYLATSMHAPDSVPAQAPLLGWAVALDRSLTLRARLRYSEVGQQAPASPDRIHAVTPHASAGISLQTRFDQWCARSDKLLYEDHLHKAWLSFELCFRQRDELRSPVSQWLWGTPEAQYQRSLGQLVAAVGLHLSNLWQQDLGAFWDLLATRLMAAQSPPAPASTEADGLVCDTLQQLVMLPPVASRLLEQSRQWRHFDDLYETILRQMTAIVTELSDKNRVTAGLLESVLDAAGVAPDEVRQGFFAWLEAIKSSGLLQEGLRKIEQWKRAQHPRQAPVVFVVASYFFSELLPDYFQSLHTGSRFAGRFTPVSIGRRKDFWHNLQQATIDLRIQAILNQFKPATSFTPLELIERVFNGFYELDAEVTTADPCRFPGFAEAISKQRRRGHSACGLLTGIARFSVQGQSRNLGLFVSNHGFQAGAFDMASAERLCRLLDYAAKSRYPVVGLICSAGMQTKEGPAALFSMAVVTDAISRFRHQCGLPLLVVGYGDCTGGAQASLVTHPDVETWYLSGTNMPFAGRIVVPDYLPVSATLANYLCADPLSMRGLLRHPLAPGLDEALAAIDPRIGLPQQDLSDMLAQWLVRGASLDPAGGTVPPTAPGLRFGPIASVLVHARGCTAVKLVQEAQAMGLRVVLVQSDPDMDSVAARMLRDEDSLVCLGGFTPDESYLNGHSVVHIAQREQVDALHPGIGFLSENHEFARLCLEHDLNFVGPAPATMEKMGDKAKAIRTAMQAGIPVVPGSASHQAQADGLLATAQAALEMAQAIGYPVILKAVYGGGGKGIAVVNEASELLPRFDMIRAQARSAFGKEDIYLERFVTRFRHIEVQILRDRFGATQVLGLRDCSVQRDKQKIIEESGSTALSPVLAQLARDSAHRLACACDYTGAGTVEFLYDLDQDQLYFMEMNTRLQVEHPVTEMVSGVDIVREQFRIARGESIASLAVVESGYAVEVRINAEAVWADAGELQVVPSPGQVSRCRYPLMEHCRAIWAIADGTSVPSYYDNLVAQVIAWGESREQAIARLCDYLAQVEIEGIATNLPLLRVILRDEVFLSGEYDTRYLKQLVTRKGEFLFDSRDNARLGSEVVPAADVAVSGSDELKVFAPASSILYRSSSPEKPAFVREGDTITTDQTLCLLEVMKMFQPLTLGSLNQAGRELYPASQTYRVTHVKADDGQHVACGDLLFVVEPMVA